MEWRLLEREGLEPLGTEPFVFGDERSLVKEKRQESVVWKRWERNKEKRKERKGTSVRIPMESWTGTA